MLTYKVIGPYEDGSALVAYKTPGCESLTIACACLTREQAEAEAERMNQRQLYREMDIRRDRELRGQVGVYPGLEARGL